MKIFAKHQENLIHSINMQRKFRKKIEKLTFRY